MRLVDGFSACEAAVSGKKAFNRPFFFFSEACSVAGEIHLSLVVFMFVFLCRRLSTPTMQ